MEINFIVLAGISYFLLILPTMQKEEEEDCPKKTQAEEQEKEMGGEKLNQHGRPKQQVIFYELTSEMKEMAMDKIGNDMVVEDEQMYEKAERETGKVWDKFYRFHKCAFFKDRTYLEREIKPITVFKELFEESGRVSEFVELGCGVGNTLFPLLREYKCFRCFGFDISAKAIELIREEMQEHPEYQDRLQVEVCDLAKHELPFKGTGDLNTLIFVLSAIVPQKHLQVMAKISQWMKPGSFLYFRDYGRYDFGQLNLSSKGNRKIRDNFYMKNDGVCVYYFEVQELLKMCELVGLEVVRVGPLCKLLQNRKRGLKMYRVWLQGLFYKPPLSPQLAHKMEWMLKAYQDMEDLIDVQRNENNQNNQTVEKNEAVEKGQTVEAAEKNETVEKDEKNETVEKDEKNETVKKNEKGEIVEKVEIQDQPQLSQEPMQEEALQGPPQKTEQPKP